MAHIWVTEAVLCHHAGNHLPGILRFGVSPSHTQQNQTEPKRINKSYSDSKKFYTHNDITCKLTALYSDISEYKTETCFFKTLSFLWAF